MTSVYLIRHAQALGNVEERFQGHTDHPLTPQGEYQARLLALRMSAIPLNAVYTSPLLRARQTAAPMAENHRLQPVVHEGLIEINGGELENKSFAELREHYPENFRAFTEEPHRFTSVGGESILEVYGRIKDAILQIVEQNTGKTIAIVSHGCAVRCFLSYALGYPFEQLGTLPWGGNTSVSHILFHDAHSPVVRYHGDQSHLPLHMRRPYRAELR